MGVYFLVKRVEVVGWYFELIPYILLLYGILFAYPKIVLILVAEAAVLSHEFLTSDLFLLKIKLFLVQLDLGYHILLAFILWVLNQHQNLSCLFIDFVVVYICEILGHIVNTPKTKSQFFIETQHNILGKSSIDDELVSFLSLKEQLEVHTSIVHIAQKDKPLAVG